LLVVPFYFNVYILIINCFILQILLNQIAALVLSNFSLALLNFKIPFLRQHTVNQYFFVFYPVQYVYWLAIQPYLQQNVLFINNAVLVNSIPHPTPPPPGYMHTQVRPSGEFLTNYVALLWIEAQQPCHRGSNPHPSVLSYEKC